jgi:hypothetical protein
VQIPHLELYPKKTFLSTCKELEIMLIKGDMGMEEWCKATILSVLEYFHPDYLECMMIPEIYEALAASSLGLLN